MKDYIIFKKSKVKDNPDGWGLVITAEWDDHMTEDDKEMVMRYMLVEGMQIQPHKK